MKHHFHLVMTNFLFVLISLHVVSGLASAAELPLVVEPDTQPLKATVKLNGGQLSANFGVSLPKVRTISPCEKQDGGCWQWSDGYRLDIQDDPRNVLCKTIVWSSPNPTATYQDCWNLTDKYFWYGGGSRTDQKWPMETEPLFDEPQVTGAGTEDGSWNNIHNRVWFSTMGVAIKVEDNVPLFVTIDQDKQMLCFEAAKKDPYRYKTDFPTALSYNVCYGQNLTQLYLGVMRQFFKLPTAVPDLRIFRSPVWNTWPKFQEDMNSNTLKEYVNNITNFVGTAGSILVIGQGWESCIGDHQFSSTSFPDPKGFIQGFLKQNEMEASLWIHPKMNTHCHSYQEGFKSDYFVRNRLGHVLFSQWHDNNVSTIDFTRQEEVQWWSNRLQNLRDTYGVTSFYFDHGQTSFLPNNYFFSAPKDDQQPDIYSTKYVDLAATFGKSGIVNVGRNSQQHPLFVRMPEKLGVSFDQDSLQSVIPSILQMGINGFPFVLPEVVGGSYHGNALPDRKLYIRWLELSAFLPAVHFSVGPWEYDDGVVEIGRRMFDHRSDFIEDIIHLAHSAVLDGAPIIRPLWWLSPNDTHAAVISDQFLVGNSLMVAPIVDDREERDIYFPAGVWMSPVDQNKISGPKWLKKHSVKLHEIAFFKKISE